MIAGSAEDVAAAEKTRGRAEDWGSIADNLDSWPIIQNVAGIGPIIDYSKRRQRVGRARTSSPESIFSSPEPCS
jgi:hypothetical protein